MVSRTREITESNCLYFNSPSVPSTIPQSVSSLFDQDVDWVPGPAQRPEHKVELAVNKDHARAKISKVEQAFFHRLDGAGMNAFLVGSRKDRLNSKAR